MFGNGGGGGGMSLAVMSVARAVKAAGRIIEITPWHAPGRHLL